MTAGGDLLVSLALTPPGDLLLDLVLEFLMFAGFLERVLDLLFFNCFSKNTWWLLTSLDSSSKFSLMMTGFVLL